jgi:geranyl-CoA carboxylase beta subunit
MPVYDSQLDTLSDNFIINRRDMLNLLDHLDVIKLRAQKQSVKRKQRFDERGQLTPRERLQRLLDPGMPFPERAQVPAESLLIEIKANQ